MGNRNSRSCQPHLFHFQLARTSAIFIPPSWARDAGGYGGRGNDSRKKQRVPDTISALVFQRARGNLFSNASSTLSPSLSLLHASDTLIISSAHVGDRMSREAYYSWRFVDKTNSGRKFHGCKIPAEDAQSISNSFRLSKKNCDEDTSLKNITRIDSIEAAPVSDLASFSNKQLTENDKTLRSTPFHYWRYCVRLCQRRSETNITDGRETHLVFLLYRHSSRS